MITTNSLLRIDTFESHDLAYLINSPDRYEISREVTRFLLDIKITPISSGAYHAYEPNVSKYAKNALLYNQLVLDSMVSKTFESKAKFFSLESYNWRLASDYLERTRDYKFFDYAKDGWQKDARMMASYLEEEAEQNRSKKYIEVSYEPWRYTAVEAITGTEIIAKQNVFDFVFNSVVATFGTLRNKSLSQGEPVLQKSIPSGGSRHPTEAYVIDVRKKDIYHYCCENNAFGKISMANSDFYTVCFGEPETYVPFKVNYIVLLTCVWERNMFRYREPRTFRSVHLDAGHAVCNIEVLCQKAKVRYKVQYGMNSKVLEGLLKIDPLVEGIMCAVMIGGRKEK